MQGLHLIIIMEICKAPTLQLKALNKHTHIMYIEMENVIQKINYIYRHVFKHNYTRDAHAHTRMHVRAHTHTYTVQTDKEVRKCLFFNALSAL